MFDDKRKYSIGNKDVLLSSHSCGVEGRNIFVFYFINGNSYYLLIIKLKSVFYYTIIYSIIKYLL